MSAKPGAVQAALSVAYGARLRVGEVAMLKVHEIDSERMLIWVEHGKGGRYRNAMLSPDLLTLLRHWWQHGHSKGILRAPGGSRNSLGQRTGSFQLVGREADAESPPASGSIAEFRLLAEGVR